MDKTLYCPNVVDAFPIYCPHNVRQSDNPKAFWGVAPFVDKLKCRCQNWTTRDWSVPLPLKIRLLPMLKIRTWVPESMRASDSDLTATKAQKRWFQKNTLFLNEPFVQYWLVVQP